MEWLSILLDHPEYAFGIISLVLAYHIVKTFVKSSKEGMQQVQQAVVSMTKILDAHERRLRVIEKRPVDESVVDEEFRKLNNLPAIKYD